MNAAFLLVTTAWLAGADPAPPAAPAAAPAPVASYGSPYGGSSCGCSSGCGDSCCDSGCGRHRWFGRRHHNDCGCETCAPVHESCGCESGCGRHHFWEGLRRHHGCDECNTCNTTCNYGGCNTCNTCDSGCGRHRWFGRRHHNDCGCEESCGSGCGGGCGTYGAAPVPAGAPPRGESIPAPKAKEMPKGGEVSIQGITPPVFETAPRSTVNVEPADKP